MEVSDQIIAVINSLCEKFGLAIDWTAENVVPYIQELINKYCTYEIWSSAIYVILWVAGMVGLWIFGKHFAKQASEVNWDPDYGRSWAAIIFIVLAIIVTIVGIVCSIGEIDQIITACVFPEKLVYDYINSLTA